MTTTPDDVAITYRRALAMRADGATNEAVAAALGIEPAAVPNLLLIAEMKSRRSMDHDAMVDRDSVSYALAGPFPFELPFDPTSSVLAERTAWAVERLAHWDWSLEIIAAYFPDRVPENWIRMLERNTRKIARVSSYREDGCIAYLDAKDEEGRARVVRVVIHRAAPHTIRTVSVVHAPPPGLIVRPATVIDEPELRALEVRTPVVADDVPITYDRGERYLDSTRLIDRAFPLVATDHGKVVGLHCDALLPARIGSRAVDLLYRHHTRVDPDHQGRHVWQLLSAQAQDVVMAATDEFYECALVRVDNSAMQARMQGMPGLWSTQVEQYLIDCRAAAGPATGRPAGPADAARIAALCNEAHDGEQLFVPYTRASLVRRLERAPDLYSWQDVLVGENAVVGVWDRRLLVRRGEETQVRAVVLDSGFPTPDPAALVPLLRAWCGVLAKSGVTHLAALSSSRSPDRDVLAELSPSVEIFDFTCRIPEPQPPAGVRLDAVYF